jgi:hypothetical protein
VLTAAVVAAAGLLAIQTYYRDQRSAISDHRAAAVEAAAAKLREVDKAALEKQVTAGLQTMLDDNEVTRDYRIQFAQDTALFQVVQDGSEYRGLVTARTQRGTEVPVMVTVYADGSGPIIYEMDSASNLRLTQIAADEQQ